MNKIIIAVVVVVALIIGGYYLLVPKSPVTLQNQKADKHLVEVFHLSHAPAVAVVDKVEEIIKKHPEYTLKRYDFDDPKSNAKVTQYGLEGHMPVAIFIGGKNTFTFGGKQVSFQNFPKGDAFIPSFEGPWSYENLKEVLSNPDKH